MTPDPVTAWTAVLDELERVVAEAERSLADGEPGAYADWAPPTGLGPLPPGLVDRARELADRQQRAVGGLEPVVAAIRNDLAASRRAGRGAGRPTARPATSVYLDVTA